jgi:tRNA pseudouridine13 synthase
MKLKCTPQDFQVEELTAVKPSGRGHYNFYRLTKRGLGTIEVVEAICRRWNLASHRISYGGLKDRHAQTTQYLTIQDGPARALRENSFELEPIGRLPHPYGPRFLLGNRFRVVMRDLETDRAALAAARLQAVSTDSLPNYFDDQRFGSVGCSSEFIGQAWLKGKHERALWLAIAEANPFDRSAEKAQKAILRELWGRWSDAKAALERSSTRSIITYLVDHPADFRGAFARLKRELRSLYFSAFQSHLWNLLLSCWIEQNTRPDQRVMVDMKVANLAFPRGLEPRQRSDLEAYLLPLPSARTPLPGEPLGSLMMRILEPFQLSWNDLRVRHLKDVFFSKGTRLPLVTPENVEFSLFADDLHAGRQALRMEFELGRGSYATILVKQIVAVADQRQ